MLVNKNKIRVAIIVENMWVKIPLPVLANNFDFFFEDVLRSTKRLPYGAYRVIGTAEGREVGKGGKI